MIDNKGLFSILENAQIKQNPTSAQWVITTISLSFPNITTIRGTKSPHVTTIVQWRLATLKHDALRRTGVQID